MTIAAEDVADEGEAARFVGRQADTRLLARHDVGAQAEVGHLEAVDAVLGREYQHEWMAELGRDLVRVKLELLGADAKLDGLVRGEARSASQRAAQQQRDRRSATHDVSPW